MNDKFFKLPRLYTASSLTNKGVIALSAEQAHYLHNVLRRKNGDAIRVFDGVNGEWLGILQNLGKKSGEALLDEQLVVQPKIIKHTHLLFTPIKKNRMEWLIEKSVELGVTNFHPVLTQNTQIHKIKKERLQQQIFEAAEQCECFEMPTLHETKTLDKILSDWPKDIELFSCLERYEGQALQPTSKESAILIGPEGGFTSQEKDKITMITTVITLGDKILRSETAALKALSIMNA